MFSISENCNLTVARRGYLWAVVLDRSYSSHLFLNKCYQPLLEEEHLPPPTSIRPYVCSGVTFFYKAMTTPKVF